MKKSGFLLYAAAILAAILDYKNAKLVTSSHPVRISSMYQVLLKNAKKWFLPNIARFLSLATGL